MKAVGRFVLMAATLLAVGVVASSSTALLSACREPEEEDDGEGEEEEEPEEDGGIEDDDASTGPLNPPLEPPFDDDAGPECQPGDVSAFTPPAYVPATAKNQNKCTPAMIGTFFDDCLDVAKAAKVKCTAEFGPTAPPASRACATCLVSMSTDPKRGAVVRYAETFDINVAGCLELQGSLPCAQAYASYIACQRAACTPQCPIKDEATAFEYEVCADTAAAGPCSKYAPKPECIGVDPPTTGVALCMRQTSYYAMYENIATLFCGP